MKEVDRGRNKTATVENIDNGMRSSRKLKLFRFHQPGLLEPKVPQSTPTVRTAVKSYAQNPVE